MSFILACSIPKVFCSLHQEKRKKRIIINVFLDIIFRFSEEWESMQKMLMPFQQPSVNMDDTGMFSVQVITSALKLWDLTLVPYESSSSLAQKARGNPT